ncbi:MAG: DAK2 domain-containing protein [Clostridia bacterium]|nr:DAK2 domain-containing protein [Clostridia bacterium]
MIQYQTIDGLLLRDMTIAGSALLEKHHELVDALNVFPVPDGDTGTNMSLTMQSAIREVNSKEFLRADEAAAALAKGALRGARGNSGVITSQLLRGFAKAIAGQEKITPEQFAEALKAGADKAYKAVMKPKEGTILTVARVIAEHAQEVASAHPDDFGALMSDMLTTGEQILSRTPEMLPALREANVVDSGGKGLLFIYQGYAAVIRGESLEEILSQEDDGVFRDDHEAITELKSIYHLKFAISHLSEDCTEGDIDSFRRHLNRVGEMVQVEGDLEGVSVHVHTNVPGNVIDSATDLGEVVSLELEDIRETRRAKEAPDGFAPQPDAPHKPYGMVAVSLGKGFSQIFRDLTVDCVVEGGQTMNPSTEDILKAIRAVNADTVFVFPNNGNVVMAARQAAGMAESQVIVIPTKNVAMGIAAAVAFQPDSDAETNEQRMTEAAERVKTATVTYAVRDSENNGVTIHQGDYIGLHNGQIEYASSDLAEVVSRLMEATVTDEDELITVYYGEDVKAEDAEHLAAEIAGHYPDCDTECLCGGQPLYYYLISVE